MFTCASQFKKKYTKGYTKATPAGREKWYIAKNVRVTRQIIIVDGILF